LQLFKQLLTVFSLDLCWASCTRSVVGRLFDRLFLVPIEPVADCFLDDSMALSQRIQLVALLTSDRRENTFSRLPFVDLDLVEPARYHFYYYTSIGKLPP
jgi:hypothetical protein